MSTNCIFTICSKNYLAQALTLKESAKKHETDTDFFIFLADLGSEDIKEIEYEPLDESWIPSWKEMAFKYNVIEFNTSIKPFCFKKLFNQGYEKVTYLDPDMFVTDKLDYLWDNLDKYSIILTPHISCCKVDFNGAQTEKSILSCGIFNLGFASIKNDNVGRNIVEWWCVRLKDQCYDDGPLFVDQKWMNFIPVFFPEQVLVSHHFGLNVAVWNLHERELLIDNGKYKVKNLETGEIFPLLVFHFSGFDPFNDKVINRRHSQFGVDIYPSFEPIIQEYKSLEYKNGYEKYSRLTYALNEFSNGFVIMPLHRRLYRATLAEFKDDDPFSADGCFYKNLEKSKLIAHEKNKGARYKNEFAEKSKSTYIHYFQILARIFKRIVGIKFYCKILNSASKLCQLENHTFLMQNMKNVDKNMFFTMTNEKN